MHHGVKYRRKDLFLMTTVNDTLWFGVICFSSGFSMSRTINPTNLVDASTSELPTTLSIPIIPRRKKPRKTARKIIPANLERLPASVDAVKYPIQAGTPKPKYPPMSVEKTRRVGNAAMLTTTGIRDKSPPIKIQYNMKRMRLLTLFTSEVPRIAVMAIPNRFAPQTVRTWELENAPCSIVPFKKLNE